MAQVVMKKFVILFGFILINSALWAQYASKSDFFGTWYLEENNMYYTISEDMMIAEFPNENSGFTVIINRWEYAVNKNLNIENYPDGYIIHGTIETMTGNWWIGTGDSDIWTWFISKDSLSILSGDDIDYEFIYRRITE